MERGIMVSGKKMKTIKNGFKNVTTDFYYFQTSKLDKNIRNYF